MKHTHGLEIPQTLDEHCDPRTMALLVYDMQVGIRSQLKTGDQIVERAGRAVAAAEGGNASRLHPAFVVAQELDGRDAVSDGNGVAAY